MKKREQRSLIDFKLVDAQVIDTTQEMEIDGHEKDLVNGMDNLTLDTDKTAPTDALAPKLDVTDTSTPQLDTIEKEHEEEATKDKNIILIYSMTEQEQRLQCEGKFNIYMSTFGYEGDDLDLDTETDSDSNATAYPYLE